MDVKGVSTQSTAQSTQRTPQTQLGKDEFLGILAAQLRYQDPLSGGDNTQYIAQLAQFSSLEQMQNMNTTISDMLYFQYLEFGSQLVGKSVTLIDGQRLLQGVVEKVRFADGEILVVVDGTSYKLYQVKEIINGSHESTEPEEASAAEPVTDADSSAAGADFGETE